MERTTDREIVGIVDGGFGPKGLAFFVVLLTLDFLSLGVQAETALSQDARAEASRRAARYAAVEDRLHLIGTAQVEIFTDDLFEETAACERPIEHLGQGELGLQDTLAFSGPSR